MKQIEMFEYNVKRFDELGRTEGEINTRIQHLNEKGIENIDIQITQTGNGVVVSLIYNTVAEKKF